MVALLLFLACKGSMPIDTSDCAEVELAYHCDAGQELAFRLPRGGEVVSVEGCTGANDCLPLNYHRSGRRVLVHCTRNDTTAIMVYEVCGDTVEPDLNTEGGR